MADERDIRIRMDLTFPIEVKKYAEQIRDLLTPLYINAVVINEGSSNEERGHITIERCGHRLGAPCEVIAKWEVGRGKVV